MKTVSAKVPDETAEKFEKLVLLRRLQGEDVSKSEVVRECVEQYVADHEADLDKLEEFDL